MEKGVDLWSAKTLFKEVYFSWVMINVSKRKLTCF